MKMKSFFLSVLLSFITFTSVWAVKAWPGLHTKAQADGTVLTYQVVGDEYCHALVTTDGFLLISESDGRICYARKATNGMLESSGMMAHDVKMRSENERVELSSWGVSDFSEMYKQHTLGAQRAIKRLPGQTFPTTGNLKGIILLVEFADNEMQEGHGKELFHQLMNDKGCTLEGATGSARDYFVDQSGGLFTPDFDVVGPIKLSHRMAYYGANNSQGEDSKPGVMVKEACEYASDSLGVDFSKYDFDNDGTVDFVYVIYAGYAESYGASSNTIWPHASQLTRLNINCSLNGKVIDSYACSSELKYTTGTKVEGIGTFCHEFSHVLGLPDMYNTRQSMASELGTWDVMDQGNYNNESHTPPSMSAFERASLGWMELTEIDTPADSMTLPEMTSHHVAYRISTSDPNEFFTLENRQQVGWDAYQPGKGLMIMHIAYEETAWKNNYVNSGSFPRYDLVEADGTQGNGEATDLYPTAGNDMFTDYSSPNALSWAGVPTEKGITNIRDDDGVISFTFMKDRLHRPVLEDVTDVTSNSFTAHWGEVEGAIGYRLHIDEQLPDSINPVLLSEDFTGLVDGEYPKSSSTDISESLENYLSGSPWYGSCLYSCGGYLRMGGYGQSGQLLTPMFDTALYGGKLTLSFDARSYPSKNVAFTVSLVDVPSGDILASKSLKANKNEANYHIVFNEGTTNCRFVIATDKERLFINRMRVVKGDVSEEEVWTLGPKSWEVDSIRTTSYTVDQLAEQRTYHFTVMALAETAQKSSLSSTVGSATTLSAVASVAETSVSKPHLLRVEYYDLLGRRLASAAKGFVIWRKVFEDGTVETGKCRK